MKYGLHNLALHCRSARLYRGWKNRFKSHAVLGSSLDSTQPSISLASNLTELTRHGWIAGAPQNAIGCKFFYNDEFLSNFCNYSFHNSWSYIWTLFVWLPVRFLECSNSYFVAYFTHAVPLTREQSGWPCHLSQSSTEPSQLVKFI